MAEKNLKIQSLKSNFVLNTSRTLLNILLPLITFPYISRVLGPDYLGRVDFANSVVTYFILFTGLGIPSYGIREIARVRDDEVERSKVFWELTIICLVNSIFGYFIYFILLFTVPVFNSKLLLFLIISPNIILSDLNSEWFYQGIENQKYITIRYLFIKIIQIFSIFLLIHSKDDYILYAVISVGLNSLSTFFNLIKIKSYVSKVKLKDLEFKKHLKPMLAIFGSYIAISIYTYLDVIMLGFFKNDEAVGYYTTAHKIIKLIMTVVTALNTVMIPRIENVFKKGEMEEYYRYVNISLNYILFFSIPCILGLLFLASDLVTVFAGQDFLNSTICLKILSLIILINSLEGLLGYQILYPRRKEFKFTIATIFSALINFIFNLIMIPKFAQNGVAIGSVIAELSGLLVLLFFTRSYIDEIGLFSINTLKIFFSALIMGLVLFFVPINIGNLYLKVFVKIFMSINVYLFIMVLIKEKFMIFTIDEIKKRKLRKK